MRTIALVAALWTAGSAILYNIDQPVPISLAHGEYFASIRLWGAGGMMARVGVGLFDRLTLGMSYGADKVIGSDTPAFYDRWRPDLQARLAILYEEGYMPNFVLGFESQGYDACVEREYWVREKGGYVCVGKTLEPTRTFCQLGLNYWDGFDGFLAVNQLLPGNLEAIFEFDPAFNQNKVEGVKKRGFMNFGLAWTFDERLRLAVGLRDILGNRDETRLNRVLELSFNNNF